MKRIANRREIQRDVPLFEDNAETEIDEIFDSICWDLPGRRPGGVRRPIRSSGPRAQSKGRDSEGITV
jgi:hypothetical protein